MVHCPLFRLVNQVPCFFYRCSCVAEVRVCSFPSSIHRIEYPKLEGTHKDLWVQPLAPQNPWKYKPCVWEGCPNTHWTPAFGAMPTTLGSPFHALCPLVQTLSLTPSCPSPDTAPYCSLWSCRCPRRPELSAAPPLPLELNCVVMSICTMSYMIG